MAISSFEALCAGFCDIAGVPTPALAEDANGVLAFTITLHGIAVSVATRPASSPEHLFIIVEFGAVPADDALEIWTSLLDANFMLLGQDGPAFSRNPETGEALLQQRVAFAQATPQQLYQAVLQLTDVATRWRQDYFLSPAEIAGEREPYPGVTADFA